MLQRGLLLVAATAMAVLLTADMAATGAAPSPTAGPNNYLSAVECPSATSCLAVGDDGTSVFEYQSLVELWNGTKWTIESSPQPGGAFVNGLSCPSKSVCWAVGGYLTPEDDSVTFAMRWNGKIWQEGNPPDPSSTSSEFASMHCLSTLYCLAAGSYVNNSGLRVPLIALYSVTTRVGVRWYVQTNPTPSGSEGMRLTDITCDGASDCNAVGDYEDSKGMYKTAAEHWNGSSWKLASSANPAGSTGTYLTGLACASKASCMAVGYYQTSDLAYRNVVEKWNGTKWTLAATANGGSSDFLNAIACSGTSFCVAVGTTSSSKSDVALTERWNGVRWSVLRSPSPGTNGQLTGVTCTSTSSCTAVGDDTDAGGVSVTLAEHWNGSTWSVERTPNG